MSAHGNGQVIMFYSCGFIHSLLLSFFFFPRLFSAVAEWISTILLHMIWPLCEFRMQVWNVLHAARWKYRTQKLRKNRHLRTMAQLCQAICSQLRHMFPQYGELRSTNGWDRLASLEHPNKFQRVSRHGFVTAPTSLNEGQPNFAQCLAVFRAGTLYAFLGALVAYRNSARCNIDFASKSSVLLYLLAALLHGTRAVGVSQTLRRVIFTRQGGHPVRHWAVGLSIFSISLSVCLSVCLHVYLSICLSISLSIYLFGRLY